MGIFDKLDSPQRRAQKLLQERLAEQREALDTAEESLCQAGNQLENAKVYTAEMIAKVVDRLHEARFQLSNLNSIFKKEESKHAPK